MSTAYRFLNRGHGRLFQTAVIGVRHVEGIKIAFRPVHCGGRLHDDAVAIAPDVDDGGGDAEPGGEVDDLRAAALGDRGSFHVQSVIPRQQGRKRGQGAPPGQSRLDLELGAV